MIALEFPGDGGVLDRNVGRLMSLVPDTGGQTIGLRFGTQTLTWPGSTTTTGSETITHGLGATPVVVLVGIQAESVAVMSWANNVGATTFTVAARTGDGTSPAADTTCTLAWLAIG